MELFLIFLVVLAGATMPVQAGINAQLQAHWANSSVLAALISFAVGTLGLAVVVLASRIPIPPLVGKTALWHWSGGLLGAYFVTIMAFLAPRMGAAALVAFILAGQVGMSLICDQFGLLGYAQRAATWPRLLGLVMVGGGVFLIRRF